MSGPPAVDPWLRPATDVAHALGSDLENGLSGAEAANRLARVGPNELEAARTVPRWRALLGQLEDPLVFLLLVAMVISLVAWWVEGRTETPFDVIVIAAVVVLNAVVGYVQEDRAEHAVAALRDMAAPTARVVRDGVDQQVPGADVVPGDLLLLAEGDAVGADARLFEVASLATLEASLTGESHPVGKDIAPLEGTVGLGDRDNMVFSGTAVARGRGRAIVTATGMRTETGAVASLLGRTEDQRTPLQREVAFIGRLLGIAVVAIAVVVVIAIVLTSDLQDTSDYVSVLLVGVSLAVAAVPEGLPAILSLVLALGVQRMARERAIVKRLSSVETLGSASVVCSDKTGTLTENRMTVQKVVTPSGEVDVTGGGYELVGDLQVAGAPLGAGPLRDEVEAVLAAGSLSNDAALRIVDGRAVVQGDPTEAAFLVAEAKLGLTDARRDRFERVGEIPFTSARKLMTTLQADARAQGGIAVVTKGAPDVLLGRCSRERAGGVIRPLTDARRHAVLDAVDRLAGAAMRTLAVAYRPVGEHARTPADASPERELVYLGVVGIADPARREARAAVAEARAAGVRILMITGDHPRTAARIAADLGIADERAPVATGHDLEALTDDDLVPLVRATDVYARTSPEHKLRIVDALQSDGSVVAMTGDGVNDAPALRAADIGVAMGVAGTDVAKEAADMVLADDNFATIVAAVREGRGIFSDIRKFLRFLLSSNVGEVLTMFLGVVLAGALGLEDTGEAVAVPLLATQILWINLLTDTAPALAMGVDPPPDDVMARPPRPSGRRVIDREMATGIGWVGLVMALVTLAALDLRLAGGVLGGAGGIVEARTMAFTTLVLAQLFNCLNARSDRTSAFHRLFTNRWLWGAIALSAALQVAVVQVPFLNDAFDTVPLGVGDWLVCIGLASVVLWAGELRKLARHLVSR
jgi:magnesium-transporting ATPase (P-type)